MINWYVCTTGINQEPLAEYGLKSKGFETYVPTGKRLVRHSRQRTIRTFPIFSRYIFVKFNAGEPGYSEPIRTTDGILGILCNNWEPVSVPHGTIEDIQKRQLAGEFDHIPEKKKQKRWGKGFEMLRSLLNV